MTRQELEAQNAAQREMIAQLAWKVEALSPSPFSERQLDIIAALTENDIRAMPGSVFGKDVLDGLTRSQLEHIVIFLKGWAPDGVARAVQAMIVPDLFPAAVTA